MRKRRKKNTLPELKDQRIAELEEQLAQALATIQQLQKLQKEVERLQAEVEELKRSESVRQRRSRVGNWWSAIKYLGAKQGKVGLLVKKSRV